MSIRDNASCCSAKVGSASAAFVWLWILDPGGTHIGYPYRKLGLLADEPERSGPCLYLLLHDFHGNSVRCCPHGAVFVCPGCELRSSQHFAFVQSERRRVEVGHEVDNLYLLVVTDLDVIFVLKGNGTGVELSGELTTDERQIWKKPTRGRKPDQLTQIVARSVSGKLMKAPGQVRTVPRIDRDVPPVAFANDAWPHEMRPSFNLVFLRKPVVSRLLARDNPVASRISELCRQRI